MPTDGDGRRERVVDDIALEQIQGFSIPSTILLGRYCWASVEARFKNMVVVSPDVGGVGGRGAGEGVEEDYDHRQGRTGPCPRR